MTAHELWNRGNNLVSIAIIAIGGLAFFPEVFAEDELLHKLDDGLLFILSLVSIIWYRKKNNRFSRSLTPVIFTLTALAVKFLAILIEIKDKEDIGDDFGGLILFVLAALLSVVLYRRIFDAKAKS